MTPVDRLMNLGPVTAAWLREAGIDSAEALREIGSVAAYVRLRFVLGRRVSRNALHAMEAALLDIPWHALPQATKDRLDAEVAAAEKTLARRRPGLDPNDP